MSPAAAPLLWVLGFILFVLMWYLIIKTAVTHGIAKVIHFLAGHGETATAVQLRIDFALLLNRLASGQASALSPDDEDIDEELEGDVEQTGGPAAAEE